MLWCLPSSFPLEKPEVEAVEAGWTSGRWQRGPGLGYTLLSPRGALL